MQFIPATIQDVTLEWLNSALNTHPEFENQVISGIDLKTIGEDFGFASTIARINLQYDSLENAGPDSLVIKLTGFSDDADRTQKLKEKNRREALFYQNFQEDLGLRVPRCYYSDYAESPSRIVLLLEDINSVEFGDVEKSCTPDHARQVMKGLAQLHAQWWNHPELENQSWLTPFTTSLDRFYERRPVFLERYSELIPEDVAQLTNDINDEMLTPFERLSGPPVTLIHVDMHLDNIAFDSKSGEMILFDWQGVGIGNGAVDIGAFLSSSFGASKDLGLIEHYHQELSQLGIQDYAFEECYNDCRLSILRWWIGTVCGMGSDFALTWKGRQKRLIRQSIERRVESIRDYRLDELIKATK